MSGAFFFIDLQHFLEMLHHLLPYIDRFNNLRLLTQTHHPREKLRANCYWLRNSKVVCTILSQWGFVSKSIQNNANEIIVEAHFNRYQFTLIQRDTGFDGTISPRRFRTTVLTDLYDTTKDIKQAQTAAGHTTAAMTLKHYIKGRHQHTNTATPIASVYGLEN